MFRRYLLFFLILACLAAPAEAKTPAKDTQKLLGIYGGWRAYASKDVCYMALAQHFPQKKGMKRGTGYLMITHRPTAGSTDVVSYLSGYNFKSGSDAHARFGTTDFDMFTEGGTAWTRDAHTDHALAAAIHTHDRMSFTGISAGKGSLAITDKLNLKGAADAYRAIGKACGVKTDGPAKPAKTKTKKTPPHKAARAGNSQ